MASAIYTLENYVEMQPALEKVVTDAKVRGTGLYLGWFRPLFGHRLANFGKQKNQK